MTEPAQLLTPQEFAARTNNSVLAGDPRVEPLIKGATRAIRRYCRWHIAPVITETDVLLDSPGGHLLVLPTLRVEEITKVEVRHGSEWVELDVEELEWSQDGLIKHRRWPSRYRGVRLTYSHGFETVEDVVQIIQQVVGQALASPLGATREQAGQLSVSWGQTAPGVSGGLTLLQRDLDVLSTYRLERA